MKKQICLAGSIAVLLTGCINIEPALSGKAYDDYQKSIKPYLHYWEKPGMTEESRRTDWVACGGMVNGSYSSDAPSGAKTEAILESAAIKRETIGGCMKAKGYRYVK
jgi:hypothetical protein